MKKLVIIIVSLTLITSGVASAGYTTTGSSGEVSTLEILQNIFGVGMSGDDWCGTTYTDGTITATRVQDYNDPCTQPGSPGDDLYLLSSSLAPTATDQLWVDGIATATARARYAGNHQRFGYDAGSGYVELIDVGDNTGFFDIPADPVMFGPGVTWEWVRKGSDLTWYSREGHNSDDLDHLITYYVTGLNDGKTTWVVLWDDQTGGGDRDFNDFVLVITAVGHVIVPNIVGEDQPDANSVIIAAGLSVGGITEDYNDTVLAGIVLSQSPAAGTEVLTGSAVNYVVSLGKPTVPDIVGKSQPDANSAIVAAGLVVGDITEDYNDTVAAGIVLGQSPAAGTGASTGSAVNYVVSLGQPVVPDLSGMTMEDANSAIVAAGLVVGDITEDYNDTVAAGIALSQSPSAGTEVLVGSAVNYVVSLGQPTVPNVVGMTEAGARAAITAVDDLSVGSVAYEYSDTVPSGHVISQNPVGGTVVPIGTSVDLVVSSAPETYIWTNSYPWSMLWFSGENWDPVAPLGGPGACDTAIISPQYVDPLALAVEPNQGPVIDVVDCPGHCSDVVVREILGPRHNSDSDQTMWILSGDVLVSMDDDKPSWVMAESGSGTATVNILGDAQVATNHDWQGIWEGTGVINIGESAVVDVGCHDGGWRMGGGDTVAMDVNISGNAIVNCRKARWAESDGSGAVVTVDVTDDAVFDVDDSYFRGMQGDTNATITFDANAYVHVDYYLQFGYDDAQVKLNIEDNAVVEVGDYLRMADGGSQVAINVSDNAVVNVGSYAKLADGNESYVTFNISGGSVSFGEDLRWRDKGSGELNVSGGSLYTGEEIALPDSGQTGALTMTGGEINCKELLIPANGSTTFSITDGLITCRERFMVGYSGGTLAYMDGGLVDCGEFDHETNYLMDFTEGMLKIDGNDQPLYQDIYAEVLAGRITGYGGCGGRGDIHISQTLIPDHTLVWATYNPYRAWNPSPTCDAQDQPPIVELSWNKGDDADVHHIFLSTNFTDVNEGSLVAWKGAQADPDTDYTTEMLTLGQTYYWRIEEVDTDPPGRVTRGQVWTFTVQESYVVDDMESYSDNPNSIWETWLDGCGDVNGVGGNGTGSCVYTATEGAHGGDQAILYYYDNTGQDYHFGTRDCNYSEATMVFAEAEDWTGYGIRAIELWFFGDPNNDATALEPMYMVLTDDSNGEGMVVYGVKEPESLEDMQKAEWQQWDIDLAEFGIDLEAVTSIAIGFGDRTNCHDQMGGIGVMLIDDIALYPERCVPKYTPDIYDLNADCVTDIKDVDEMAENWLADER